MNKQVVVAMSGGVDSTAVAVLVREMGFEPVGVNLKMGFDTEDSALRETCKKLQMRLIVRDCAAAFRERVILPSARDYASGKTPNPCCECNAFLKFHEILQMADQLGIDQIYTGHYAQLEKNGQKFTLRCGIDNLKDQSYFLYRLNPSTLSRTNFPLGTMTKTAVRAIAAHYNLSCATKPDSQDVCFLGPGENCGEKLIELSGLPRKPGAFIYRGKLVGRHNGLHRYTLGQRQGLGVALGKPAYVTVIDSETGNIELETDPDKLLSCGFTLNRLNWQQPVVEGELKVKVRYRTPAVACKIEQRNDEVLVIPEHPLRAVTPGQAGVIYCNDILLGGGIINQVIPC